MASRLKLAEHPDRGHGYFNTTTKRTYNHRAVTYREEIQGETSDSLSDTAAVIEF